MRTIVEILCLFLLLAATACTPGSSHDEKIAAFESGVIEVDLTDTGIVQSDRRSPLAGRMEAWGSPGVSITLLENDRIAWARGWGVLTAGQEAPVDSESIFQAGSVSKFVTAVIVMHHVDAGVLDLDRDINDYLKSWRMPDNAWGKAITLRQLLAHKSGLPGTNFDRDPSREIPTLPQILSAEEPALNEPALPVSEPDVAWSYSNVGYVVVQLVLEDVLGRTFEEIAREAVFEPLHMNSTTFDYPLPEAWRVHEAMPHSDGIAQAPIQDSLARAQGGLLTTTTDLAKLVGEVMKAYRGESAAVISQQSARAMLTHEADVPAAAMGLPLGMGLGAFLETSASSLSFLHPGQSSPGSTCLLVAFPETGQAVVMATNGRMGDLLQIEMLATLAVECGLPGGQLFLPKE